MAVGSFMELTVYLGTKVHEQIRKPDSQSSMVPVLDPTCALSPQLPQVPFQPPSCHRKGWLVGRGRDNALFTQPWKGPEASSPLHLGVLKWYIYLLHRGPHILLPRTGAGIPDLENIRQEGNFKVTWKNPNQRAAHTF